MEIVKSLTTTKVLMVSWVAVGAGVNVAVGEIGVCVGVTVGDGICVEVGSVVKDVLHEDNKHDNIRKDVKRRFNMVPPGLLNLNSFYFKRCPLNFFLIELPRREMTREYRLRNNVWRFCIADDS